MKLSAIALPIAALTTGASAFQSPNFLSRLEPRAENNGRRSQFFSRPLSEPVAKQHLPLLLKGSPDEENSSDPIKDEGGKLQEGHEKTPDNPTICKDFMTSFRKNIGDCVFLGALGTLALGAQFCRILYPNSAPEHAAYIACTSEIKKISNSGEFEPKVLFLTEPESCFSRHFACAIYFEDNHFDNYGFHMTDSQRLGFKKIDSLEKDSPDIVVINGLVSPGLKDIGEQFQLANNLLPEKGHIIISNVDNHDNFHANPLKHLRDFKISKNFESLSISMKDQLKAHDFTVVSDIRSEWNAQTIVARKEGKDATETDRST